MSQLKKYLEAKPYELAFYRFWSMTVIIFFPLYGIFLLKFVPNAIDYMSHRLGFAFLWLILLISSFYVESIRKYYPPIAFVFNLILVLWVVWIVQVNDFSNEYSLGFLLIFIGMGTFLRDKYEMLFFYPVSILYIFLNFSNLTNTDISSSVLALSALIMLVFFGILMLRREYIANSMGKLNKDLVKKNRELERFVYIASHDLKSPIRTIGSFASLLKNRYAEKDENFIEYTDFIINGASQMNQVIDDLLDYYSYADDDFKCEMIDLPVLLNDLSNSIEDAYGENMVSIHFEKNIPERIKANKEQFQVLLQNLIENGIVYNISPEKEVLIKYLEQVRYHVFTIQDNGIGIPIEYKDKIFELFQRLHDRDKFVGTGIGLTICKRIVENHKGSIEVLPTSSQGAAIKFTISKRL